MKCDLLDRDCVVERVREAVAANGGRRVGLRQFLAESGLEKRVVFRHFARWEEALAAAGCDFRPQNEGIAPEVLLEDWGAVARALGHGPTKAEYRVRGKFSAGTVEKRFGGWRKVRVAFGEFARGRKGWRGVVKRMKDEGGGRRKSRRWVTQLERKEGTDGADVSNGTDGARRFWPRLKDRPVFGEPLRGGAMRHAPLNEQGVVCLFGMMAEGLGFAVEALRTGFPDCVAKRKVENGKPKTEIEWRTSTGGWETVRIEFEYESRNFREHGHDAAGCDLIVCWRDNWPECPIEVIALSEQIERCGMTR